MTFNNLAVSSGECLGSRYTVPRDWSRGTLCPFGFTAPPCRLHIVRSTHLQNGSSIPDCCPCFLPQISANTMACGPTCVTSQPRVQASDLGGRIELLTNHNDLILSFAAIFLFFTLLSLSILPNKLRQNLLQTLLQYRISPLWRSTLNVSTQVSASAVVFSSYCSARVYQFPKSK